MARRRKRQGSSKLLWYGLYAAIGYYAYNWYMSRPSSTTTVSVPPGTQ